MNIDDKAWFAELYIAVEMRCRPDLDDIDAANIVTCIESLLAENERMKAELAKYRDAPVVAYLYLDTNGEECFGHPDGYWPDWSEEYSKPLIVKPGE